RVNFYLPDQPVLFRPAAPKGRSGRRGGGEDPESGNPEEGSKPEDEEKAPRKAPSLSLPNPAVMMWQLLSSFKTFTLDFKNQDAYGYSNLVDMPSYAFQFGFSPDIPFEERNDESFNKNLIAPSIRSTNSVDGNMQVDLFKNLKSNFKYNRQKATTITDANNSETVANTVFFTGGDPGSDTKDWWNLVPDWRFSLNGVENLPMFKSWAKSASLEHARSGKYNEKTRFTTAATDGGDGVVTEGERIKDSFGFSNSYQPLIGLTVNTKWGITSSLRSNRQVTVDYQAAGAATRREQSGINFTASYAVNKGFRLPLPFLANKKLNNEITFQLAFDSNENTNYSRKPNSNEFTELDLAKSWKVRPSVSYRFSQKVNGTAFYEQGSSENKRTGVTSYKEFGINVNIAIR
nr:hypothetical protein [Calditrichia bacterium]